LLPIETTFESKKLLRRTRATFEGTNGAWKDLARVSFDGYEIRHGRTRVTAVGSDSTIALSNDAGEPLGWQQGGVLGISTHGLFEAAEVLRALMGHKSPPPLDAVFDGLADFVDRHFVSGALNELAATRP